MEEVLLVFGIGAAVVYLQYLTKRHLVVGKNPTTPHETHETHKSSKANKPETHPLSDLHHQPGGLHPGATKTGIPDPEKDLLKQ
jgi:hypothetical protein